jgi:hypothetical protein
MAAGGLLLWRTLIWPPQAAPLGDPRRTNQRAASHIEHEKKPRIEHVNERGQTEHGAVEGEEDPDAQAPKPVQFGPPVFDKRRCCRFRAQKNDLEERLR